jgi:mRNA interferase MazF
MKDFQRWHKLKDALNKSNRLIRFHTREIWWCSLGANIGFEQDGKNENFERPVLVFRKFNNNVLWILPLTSSDKIGKYYFQFEYHGKKYSIILSQIRLICAKRLLRKIRTMPKKDFRTIRDKFKNLV